MTSPPRKLQRFDPWLNGPAMQVAKKQHGHIAQRRLRKTQRPSLNGWGMAIAPAR